MPVELFGFTIGRTQKQREQQDRVSFTLPQIDDGSIEVAGTPGGAYATYLDMEGSAKNEADLIHRYRSMALHPEAELAIDVQHIYSTNQAFAALKADWSRGGLGCRTI